MGILRAVQNVAAWSGGSAAGYLLSERVACLQDPRPMPHQFAKMLDHPLRMAYRNPTALFDVLAIQPGMTVLDLGCGTGVLAILAAKMNAALPVHALDIDRRAVHSCRENARRNRIAHKIVVKQGDGSLVQINRYGIILANIHKNILAEEMDTLSNGLGPKGGHLLLSGFYSADVPELTDAAIKNGLTLVERKDKEEWVLLHLEKKQQKT